MTEKAIWRRALGGLRLDRPVFRRGEAIVVELTEAAAEPCLGATLRLRHASGRTYAQTETTLLEAGARIPLGKALNMPSGGYEVVASPPLGSANYCERRMPIRVESAAVSSRPTGAFDERREQALRVMAAQPGAEGVLARILLDKGGDSDWGGVAELVATRGLDVALAARAVADAASVSTIDAALAERLRAADGDGLAETAAQFLIGDDVDPSASIRRFGLRHEADDDEATAIAALAALYAQRRDDALADLAAVALDRAHLSFALRASAGALNEPGAAAGLSAIARLQWGVGGYSGGDAALLALAACGYEAPSVIQAIALDDGEDDSIDGGRLCWRRGGAGLMAGGGAWRARLGVEVALGGRCGLATMDGDALLATGVAPFEFPYWAVDEQRLDGARLFARKGEDYLALIGDAPWRLEPREDGAGDRLTGGERLYVQLGRAERDGDFDDFRTRVAALDVDLGAAPGADTLSGARLEPPTTRQTSPDALVSAYARRLPGSAQIEIRHGDDGLLLDFS